MTNNFKVVALYNTLAGDTTPTAEEINEYFYFLDNGTSTIEATAAQMMVDSGKDASFALLTTAQLVDTLYLGLLGKDAATDLEGKAYWIGEIETNPAINILSLAAAIVNGADATDEAYIEATFAAQTAALDAFVGEEPVIAVEGSTFELTDGADKGAEFTGTDDNDTFDASLDSARGEVFNTLSSADKLDGGAGTDTLMADLVRQSSANGDVSEVTPETTDIEIAKFNAADTTSILNNVVVQNTITVDAEEMTGVDSIGSYYSDGDLVIENLNTLTDEGQIRHTSDMTITMDHTDNFNTDEDASDLTVYFDEDYLNRTTDVQGSTLTINMINTLNLELNDGSSFIEGYDSLTFSVGDTLITVDVEGAELSAVQGLIEAAIAEAGFDDISVSTYTEDAYFGTNIYYETTDTTYNAGTYVGTYDAFILTNSSSEELIEGGFSLTDGQNDGSLAYSQNDNEAATIDLPISINVELEKVGQDAEGGNLIIGGKSNDAFGDTDVDQNDGIEQFDITVLGDEDRPSNLGIITSTNDFLTTVNIESETRTDNSYAALTVRGEAGSNVFGGTLTSLNANSFMGDLAIGEEVDALNINTFTATGGGDVELHETINGEDGVDYTITTANGEDELDITLNGDSVDTNDESVSISTGASADDITVTMDNSTTVSRETTQALDNLTINSGGGADDVQYIGQNQFIINTESGSDTVHINSFDNGSSAGAALGSWDIHASSDGATDADNGAGSGFVWTDAVLYEAELTLSFAGLEETVTIVTSATNNYIATQEDISTAIKLAIADNSELNRLLEVTEGTGSDNQITIDSTIDGVNDLVISIEQAVYNNATLLGELSTSQQAAMLTGLIAVDDYANTGAVTDSGDAIAIAALNDVFLSTDEGTDGSNETVVENDSIINVGTGANDLIVLSSHVDSVNTVVFTDESMGKTTIVNFFDAQQNALDVEFVGAGLTDATQGDHVLDFTNWLNDGLSATGSLDSYIRTATTEDLIVAGGDLNLDSNEVVVVNDWAAAAGETFALMTASDIDASLEGTTLYGSLVGSTAVAAAGTEYSGDTISSILMIENDLNEGEYNVYNVESDSTAAAGSQFAVTLVGTVDFGESYTLDSAEAANANFA